MIDIDKLQRVADRAIEMGAEKEQLFSAEEVISVFTRLLQAEKDAARYRWLRDCNWNLSVACVVVDPKKSVKLGCDCPSGCRLDELVDAHL